MSDQTTEPEMLEDERNGGLDRFVWKHPLILLEPGETYIPATIEELMEGKTGRIVKDPNYTGAAPTTPPSRNP